MSPDEREAAKLRFVREIRVAKRDGVDVGQTFVEVEEQILLARVRAFGLALSIVWVFLGPMMVPAFKVYCLRNNLVCDIPEELIYWSCLMGFVSILAFGFDLVNPNSFMALYRKDPDHVQIDFAPDEETDYDELHK